MILALLAAVQIAGGDSLPTVTLEEALRLSLRLDPDYVAAEGDIESAAWDRRASMSRFFLPNLTASTTLTEFSSDIFNVGTGQLASRIVEGRVEVGYNLFSGLSKFYEAKRASARVTSAQAGQLGARFDALLQTEADYYAVIAEQELVRVAAERVRRAEEQLAIARARVVSGAAVQTDSLQLLLELTTAQVDLLRERSELKVARIQLGRRVGHAGPVDAAPLGEFEGPELPISEAEAVREALNSGPDYQLAIANERVASAAFKSERGKLSAAGEPVLPVDRLRRDVLPGRNDSRIVGVQRKITHLERWTAGGSAHQGSREPRRKPGGAAGYGIGGPP